jgi:RNA polymerase sigma-70 factor (ECF subfamily)
MTAPVEPEEQNAYIEKEKKLNTLELALQQLNSEQQLCVTLFYLQKKSYQEITEQTNFDLMQVKSHIQNGKRNLKIIMEREGN